MLVNGMDMARMFAWAAESNQRSAHQIRMVSESGERSAGWKSLTTDFPFNEANTSLG